MVQQSVYSKLVINDASARGTIDRLSKYRPPEGLVQVLRVTEKQYSTIVRISGKETVHEEMDTMDEFVVL
jgi:CRISPR-associated protein Cas2